MLNVEFSQIFEGPTEFLMNLQREFYETSLKMLRNGFYSEFPRKVNGEFFEECLKRVKRRVHQENVWILQNVLEGVECGCFRHF